MILRQISGFSLLEMLVVVAITAFIASMAVISVSRSDETNAQRDAATLLQWLDRGESLSLVSSNQVALVVDGDTNTELRLYRWRPTTRQWILSMFGANKGTNISTTVELRSAVNKEDLQPSIVASSRALCEQAKCLIVLLSRPLPRLTVFESSNEAKPGIEINARIGWQIL